ncbi:MAG: patatin-like phospholipase family protein [Candidatus Omnitrophica bacterium]|nr:patatin-like phospholipase family protein [Candidatus Omnitrophota bacterium]
MQVKTDRPFKIGLALGSGSARGWAHLGVIQAIEESGIPIACVAGSSIGALAGAVYASGNHHRLFEFASEIDWRRLASFFDPVFPRSGLVDGKKIAAFIRSHVHQANIEDLPIPFCAVATDLSTGEEVHLREGDVIEAVRASISLPGIFTPVRVGDRFLLDGGMSNPVPVSVARAMGADYVIAVDINHDIVGKKRHTQSARRERRTERRRKRLTKIFGEESRVVEAFNARWEREENRFWSRFRAKREERGVPNIFDVLTTSINILESRITSTRLQSDPADLLIQPELGHIRFLEFSSAQEGIEAGYEAAKAALKSLSSPSLG